MYQVEQILIGVDSSGYSGCALEFARGFGEEEEAKKGKKGKGKKGKGKGGAVELALVHGVAPMSQSVRDVLFPYAALGEDDREVEAELIEAARERLNDRFDLDGKLTVAIGASHEVILERARTLDVEMIAIGAFGEGGVSPDGLGSTSRRVVASATRPVALIRDFGGRPKVRRILAAVDLSRYSKGVLEVALSVAAELGATVDVLHVVPSPAQYDTDWLLERELEVAPQQLFESVEPKARALLQELMGGLDVPMSRRIAVEQAMGSEMVGFGDPGREIAQAAHDGAYELVVVGRGARGDAAGGGPGRVASTVMVEAAAHILVVPRRSENTPLQRWGGIDR